MTHRRKFLGGAGVAAVGAAAALFSGEHEDGTAEFLGRLPLAPAQAFWGKLAMLAWSTVALQLATWLASVAMIAALEGRADASREFLVWRTVGVATVEGAAWGVLAAMFVRRPVYAALAAIALAALAAQGVSAQLTWREGPPRSIFEAVGDAWVPRWLMALGALGLALPRRHDWLLPDARRADWTRLAATWWPRRAGEAGPSAPASHATALPRLLWQQWRQGWRTYLLTLVSCVSFAVLFIGPRRAGQVVHLLFSEWAPWVVCLWTLLMGATAFGEDQARQSYRFFAERGVPPRLVWWSRQLAPVAALAPAWLLLWAALEIGQTTPSSAVPTYRLPYSTFTLAVALFALGQYVSIGTRSSLISAIKAGALALALSLGWSLVCFFESPGLWPVWLMTGVLLVGSAMYTSDWLCERHLVKSRLLSLAVVWGGLVAAYLLVAWQRVHEIPVPEAIPSTAEFQRSRSAAEKQTATLYEEAYAHWHSLPPVEDESTDSSVANAEPSVSASESQDGLHDRLDLSESARALLDANERALELALRASARDAYSNAMTEQEFLERAVHSSPSDAAYPNWSDIRDLQTKVAMAGYRADQEGRLDEAWRYLNGALRMAVHLQSLGRWGGRWINHDASLVLRQLPRWAARPGQTPARIRRALADLAAAERLRPSASDDLRHRYTITLFEQAATERGFPNYVDAPWLGMPLSPWIVKLLPGERQRARRLIDWLFASGLSRVESAERLIWQHQPVPVDLTASTAGQSSSAAKSLVERTPSLQFWWIESPLDGYFALPEVEWRVTRLLLVVQLWRLEHQGALPTRLDELVSADLQALPTDPLTATPFEYFPAGFSEPLYQRSTIDNVPILGPWGRLPLPAHAPFVWSSLEADMNWGPQPANTAEKAAPLSPEQAATARQKERLEQGYCYPIPLSAPLAAGSALPRRPFDRHNCLPAGAAACRSGRHPLGAVL